MHPRCWQTWRTAFPPDNGITAAGDIHLDVSDTWKIGFGGGGFDIFQVATHEIGHAIGLHHSIPDSVMNPFYSEATRGSQADDIAGAQFLYGAVIPEPASFLLLGTGLAGLLGWRKFMRGAVSGR